MPSNGMLSPTHELEKETYATEQRIAAKLPSIDEHIGTRREPTGAWSQYRGEPTLARSIDERSTGDAEPRGPNTTDAALMGPLPSAEEARSEVTPVAELFPKPTSTTSGVPHNVVPGLTREEQGPSDAIEAMPLPKPGYVGNQVLPPIEVTAAENRISPPELVLQPVPALREPMAWINALTSEAEQRVEALQASEITSIKRGCRNNEERIH